MNRALAIAGALALLVLALLAWPTQPDAALNCTCSDPISDFVCCRCKLILPCPIIDNKAEASHAVTETKALLAVADLAVQKQNAEDELAARCPAGTLDPVVQINPDDFDAARRLANLPALGKHGAIAASAIAKTGNQDSAATTAMKAAFEKDGILDAKPGFFSFLNPSAPDKRAFGQSSLLDAHALATTILADQAKITAAASAIAKAITEGSTCQRRDMQLNSDARLLMVMMSRRLTVLMAARSVVRYHADVTMR